MVTDRTLNNCPFCFSEKVKFVMGDNGYEYWIGCEACGARGSQWDFDNAPVDGDMMVWDWNKVASSKIPESVNPSQVEKIVLAVANTFFPNSYKSWEQIPGAKKAAINSIEDGSAKPICS